jgi:hypothetical protein
LSLIAPTPSTFFPVALALCVIINNNPLERKQDRNDLVDAMML